MVHGLSLVSTSVENVLQKRGTVSFVFLFVYIMRYPSLCAVLLSAHKSRSVVKLHWCPQNLFKSCPCVSPSRKVLRCSHHPLSSSLVLCSNPGISHCLRLVNSAKNKFVFAHSEQCTSRSAESFVWSIRVLCEVREVSDPVLRARCEVRTSVEFLPRTLEAVRSRVRNIW